MVANQYNVVYWDQQDQPKSYDGNGIAVGDATQEDTEAVR